MSYADFGFENLLFCGFMDSGIWCFWSLIILGFVYFGICGFPFLLI